MIQPNDPDLPDEIREDAPEAADPGHEAAERYRYLKSLGSVVGQKRDAAVKARKESGIEEVWTACEEAYAGIDDYNRQSGDGQQWRKPTSIAGPLTKNVSKQDDSRSTVFVRLTTRYVDMGAAKVKEKALPIDDKPFSLKPTPVPDQVMAQAAPNPATAQPAQMTPVAQASQGAEIRTATDKAADRIYDWLSEAKYGTHIRRVIDDGARLGVGVLKGPFPEERRSKAFTIKDGVGVLEMVSKTAPGVTCVDPWNFFPAGNCGEDIHSGDHCFERSFLSETKLSELKELREPGGGPIYLADQIDKVLDEGPDKCNYDESGSRREVNGQKKDLFTVWHFTGQMSRKDMIALGAVGAEELPDSVVRCHAIVTLVNDTVIRAQFNPLEKSGNLPYRVFCWSRRAGFWAGVGIAEQISVPQRMVNAGTRTWLNNAGVSAGVQLIVDDSKIAPADNSLVIGGGIKLWVTTPEGAGADMRQVMAAIAIPNLGEQLKVIIDYAFRLAEEMSNIPLVSQGQTGPQDPQTFGQAELQNNNANTLLRQIGDWLDGSVIEPLVDDFYEWLLLDSDVPNDEKGDFKVIAKGCGAMVEKAIQEQTLMMIGPMTLNPAFGLSPALWAEEMVKSKRLQPERLQMTDEEKQKMASQPPPKAPQVEAAEIRAQTDLHKQEMANQSRERIAALDTDRDTAYNNSLARRDEIQLQGRREEMQLRERLAMLEYANKNSLKLEEVKARLAETVMKLNTQVELSRDAMAVSLHKDNKRAAGPTITPPTEPAGRAEAGEAFQA